MDQEPTLREAVDAFLDDHRLSPISFGRSAMRDPHFVRDLRGGRRVWPETEQKVRTFMAEYQPEKASEEISV